MAGVQTCALPICVNIAKEAFLDKNAVYLKHLNRGYLLRLKARGEMDLDAHLAPEHRTTEPLDRDPNNWSPVDRRHLNGPLGAYDFRVPADLVSQREAAANRWPPFVFGPALKG